MRGKDFAMKLLDKNESLKVNTRQLQAVLANKQHRVYKKEQSNNSTVETNDADSMNQLCNNFLRLYLQDDDE